MQPTYDYKSCLKRLVLIPCWNEKKPRSSNSHLFKIQSAPIFAFDPIPKIMITMSSHKVSGVSHWNDKEGVDQVKRTIQAVIAPPIAVCRYGCAGCCAAPIGVFWVAGIISVIYAFFGGPAELETMSWGTLGLGVVLWTIAAVWAENTLKGVEADECENKVSNICRIVQPKVDESDPLEEVKKFQ